MKAAGPVFLIGLMGSGKTTVGKALARHLAWRWVDLDGALERRAGRKVGAIFRQDGEEAFRALESAELKRQARPGTVVSCGGGVVLRPENRRLLKAELTLYLAASPAVLAKRLRGAEAAKRPLLKKAGALAALKRLQRERARFYRASARFVLRADAQPEAVALRAFRRLQGHGVRATLLKP